MGPTAMIQQELPLAAPARCPAKAWVWPALLAAVVSLALYAVTLRGTYVYDDVSVVQDDPRVADPHRWAEFLTGAYMPGALDNLYRPLTSLSIAVEYWLHGDRPWVFHLVNVLLHAAASAAVAEFGRRLWGAGAGAIAGVLFAVHPVHVEPVAWIVGRSESLCALATMAGLCAYLGGPLTGRRVAAIYGCFLVALFSKEQGILFPFMLLALGLTRRWWGDPPAPSLDRPAPTPREVAARRWLILLFIWTLAAYLAYRESILRFWWPRSRLVIAQNPLQFSAGLDRLLLPLVLIGRYAVLLVFPLHLSIDYGGYVVGTAVRYREPYVYLGALALLAWAGGLAWAWRRRSWRVAFCLLAAAIAYVLVGNLFFLVAMTMAERVMYLPSAFLLVPLAAALARLPRNAAVAVVVTLAALGAARSFTYARQWDDRLAFYEITIRNQPRCLRIYECLDEEYCRRGNFRAAQRVGATCCRNVPEAYQGYRILGHATMELGDLSTASKIAWEGFEVDAPTHENMVPLLLELRDRARAGQGSR